MTLLSAIIKREELIEKLFPNLWVFLAHIIAATVVISLITWFVWQPTKKLVANRKKILDQKLKEADQTMKIANDYLADSKQKSLAAAKQAKQILYDSQKNLDQLYNQTKQRAEQDSKQIYEQALADAKKIRTEAQNQIKETAINLGFAIAEKIISQNLTKKINQDFIDQYLKQIN